MAKSTTENTFYFYKKKETDKIWWVRYPKIIGVRAVSFDQKKILNIFRDYPQKFTPEEKALFDKENPYWANFFKDHK